MNFRIRTIGTILALAMLAATGAVADPELGGGGPAGGFFGVVDSIDATAMVVVVGGMSYSLSSTVDVELNGLPADLSDVAPGQMVFGKLTTDEDGNSLVTHISAQAGAP